MQIGPTLTRTDRQVNAIAFSPDGRQLATTVIDGTLRLWNVKLGLPMSGPDPLLVKVAFSPDGRRIVGARRHRRRAVGCRHRRALADRAGGGDSGASAFAFARRWPDRDRPHPTARCRSGTSTPGNLSSRRFTSTAHGDRPRGVQRRRTARSPSPDDDHAVAQLWSAATGRSLGPPMAVTNPANTLKHEIQSGRTSPGVGYSTACGCGTSRQVSSRRRSRRPADSEPDRGARVQPRRRRRSPWPARTGTSELWDRATRKELPHSPLPHQTGFAIGWPSVPAHQLASGGTDATLRCGTPPAGTPTAAP